MTLSQEQLEWIVSEVVRRLRSGGHVAAPAPATASSTLEVTERLVTLETLKGKLQGVSKVHVGCRAIVTPAVKDELKEQGIELIKG